MRLRYIVSKNIKHYRKKANICDKELSLLLGKDKEFIKKLENNELKNIPLSIIERIAIILKVPVKDLVDDDKC